ncbi:MULTISPECIES: hypothetical protein [Anaerostipes]|uniref:Uncharacterized protein n=1 Tax=Anaerostipes butyraticus TaxID=645466 RepID=A0A916VCP3_9FIRM|nr:MULTISPECIES: hypothetical protein [Anaerostipes]GFO84940.1 hypothetical protein ANBU17_12870 [Anaerostipes butyraticus]
MLEIIFIIAGIAVLCYTMILKGNAWQSFVDSHKKEKSDNEKKR